MDENITINGARGIDCLVAKKVYDALSRRECLENIPFELQLPGGELSDYVYCYTQFGRAEVYSCDCEPIFTEKDENYARMRLIVGVPVYVVLKRRSDRRVFVIPAHPVSCGVVQKDNIIRIPVDTTVYAPREFLRQGRFEAQAETYVETGCVNAGCGCDTLTLSLGIFIVLRVVSDVHLRIPNYGYCEVPPECDEPCDENFCETFLDETLTPFPQFFPGDLC